MFFLFCVFSSSSLVRNPCVVAGFYSCCSLCFVDGCVLLSPFLRPLVRFGSVFYVALFVLRAVL